MVLFENDIFSGVYSQLLCEHVRSNLDSSAFAFYIIHFISNSHFGSHIPPGLAIKTGGGWYLLVEKHYVRLPDLVRRKSENADPTVVRLIPLELVVIPDLRTEEESQGWSGLVISKLISKIKSPSERERERELRGCNVINI